MVSDPSKICVGVLRGSSRSEIGSVVFLVSDSHRRSHHNPASYCGHSCGSPLFQMQRQCQDFQEHCISMHTNAGILFLLLIHHGVSWAGVKQLSSSETLIVSSETFTIAVTELAHKNYIFFLN